MKVHTSWMSFNTLTHTHTHAHAHTHQVVGGAGMHRSLPVMVVSAHPQSTLLSWRRVSWMWLAKRRICACWSCSGSRCDTHCIGRGGGDIDAHVWVDCVRRVGRGEQGGVVMCCCGGVCVWRGVFT